MREQTGLSCVSEIRAKWIWVRRKQDSVPDRSAHPPLRPGSVHPDAGNHLSKRVRIGFFHSYICASVNGLEHMGIEGRFGI